MKFRISQAANNDLRDIAAHFARDNPPRAVSFIDELAGKIRSVAGQPLLYPLRNMWGIGYRSALYRNYHIVYRVDDEMMEIVRVIHGARNIGDLLDD